MREKDDLNKGKDDWMSMQKKKQQIHDDKNLDKEHNDKIVARKLAEKEAKEKELGKVAPKPKTNPNGGFQLG